jgi:hypothetical protein
MILLTNGCSHSVPVKTRIGTDWCSVFSKKMGITDITLMGPFDDYFFNNRSLYLKTIDNLPKTDFTLSLASSGKSNDCIYFETIETIERLISDNKKPDLVLIQWSGPSRRLTMNLESETIFCVTPDDIIENVAIPHFEPLASELTIRYSSILAQYLNRLNIEYRFLFYFPTEILAVSKIDTCTNNYLNFPTGLIDTIVDKKLTWDGMGHPNEKGHEYISNIFLKSLNIKKQLC